MPVTEYRLALWRRWLARPFLRVVLRAVARGTRRQSPGRKGTGRHPKINTPNRRIFCTISRLGVVVVNIPGHRIFVRWWRGGRSDGRDTDVYL